MADQPVDVAMPETTTNADELGELYQLRCEVSALKVQLTSQIASLDDIKGDMKQLRTDFEAQVANQTNCLLDMWMHLKMQDTACSERLEALEVNVESLDKLTSKESGGDQQLNSKECQEVDAKPSEESNVQNGTKQPVLADMIADLRQEIMSLNEAEVASREQFLKSGIRAKPLPPSDSARSVNDMPSSLRHMFLPLQSRPLLHNASFTSQLSGSVEIGVAESRLMQVASQSKGLTLSSPSSVVPRNLFGASTRVASTPRSRLASASQADQQGNMRQIVQPMRSGSRLLPNPGSAATEPELARAVRQASQPLWPETKLEMSKVTRQVSQPLWPDASTERLKVSRQASQLSWVAEQQVSRQASLSWVAEPMTERLVTPRGYAPQALSPRIVQ